MEVKDLIKGKRIELGYTMKDIAAKVGVSEATISRWESGDIENMKRDKIFNLAKALKLKPTQILGIEDEPVGVKIPVLGDVAAGIPISAVENVLGTEEITKDMAESGEYFGLRIKGDSMAPRILEGDVVIVRVQPDANSGDVVIAKINGDEATCKRLKKYADSIGLISFNPAYEPMTFTAKECIELPVQIIGKVVENRQKYD